MGAREVFWCSLVASTAFVIGCGDQSGGGGDDDSMYVNQLESHVGLHCSGGTQTEQGFLFSHEELNLGNNLRLRVFGGMREPVRVRWQLCEMPSTGVNHVIINGKAKTGETAIKYWMENIASGQRINISKALNPGARLEVYSADRPDVVFVRVKSNNVKPKFLISLKNVNSSQLRSVLAISNNDAFLEGTIEVAEEVINFLFEGGRLENKKFNNFKEVGKTSKQIGVDIAGNIAIVADSAVSAYGDIEVSVFDGLGEITTGLLDDVIVPVFDTAVGGVGYGMGKLGNLIPGVGDGIEAGITAGGGKEGPSPLEQICDAINPKLVEVEGRFCNFITMQEANSQAIQTCRAYTEQIAQSVEEKSKITITFPANYCILYGHSVVQNCTSSVSPKETELELLEACKTP